MNKIFRRTAAALLSLVFCLGMTSCGGNTPATEAETSSAAPETSAPVSTAAPQTTEVPTTEIPTTEVPTTEEPTTEAPTTEEPTTEEPTTEAPALAPGWYKLVDLPTQGGPEAVDKLAAFDVFYFLVIEEGGTGYFHSAGDEKEISWDNDSITINGNPDPYTEEDGVITFYSQKQPYMLFSLSDEPVPERGETLKKTLGLYRIDEITLKDVTLIDNDEYSVVANEIIIPQKSYEDYVIKMTVTNKKIDDSLQFGVDHAVINGISVPASSTGSGASAKKGESKEFKLGFRLDAMKLAGTGDPTKISIHLRVKPQYDAKNKFLGYKTIYPMGKKKAETAERKAAETDQLLENGDKVSLTYIGMRDQSSIGYAYATFWVENKTDQVTRASLFINSINGAEARFFGESYIGPNSSGILEGLLRLDDLNGLTLDGITDIGLSFDLSDASVNPKTIAEGEYSFKP